MQKRIRSSDNPRYSLKLTFIGIIFFFVLLNISPGTCVAASSLSDGATWKSCFSTKIFEILPTPQGNSIIITTSSRAYLLSSENGALLDNITRNDTYDNNKKKVSYDGSYVVWGSWNYNNFEFQSLTDDHAETGWKYPLGQTLTDIEISADSSTIAVASYDNDLHLLTRSGYLLWKKIGTSFFRQIHVSSDGSRIAALSQNGNISFFSRKEGYLWDIAPGSPVMDFSLSQNGRFFIFGLADQSIHVLNDDAKNVIEVKLDSPVKYVSVSNTGKQFTAVLENNTILFFNQSQTPAWALSSDIPISAVNLIQEKVVSGDLSGCVYAFDNTSVFRIPYSGSNSSAVGEEQTSARITTLTTAVPKSTIIPPENSGIFIPEKGIEFFYYLLIGILLIGILVEGWKALKRDRN